MKPLSLIKKLPPKMRRKLSPHIDNRAKFVDVLVESITDVEGAEAVSKGLKLSELESIQLRYLPTLNSYHATEFRRALHFTSFALFSLAFAKFHNEEIYANFFNAMGILNISLVALDAINLLSIQVRIKNIKKMIKKSAIDDGNDAFPSSF